ncbi:hypothetical protein FKR81_30915 [Lentzea tibetensis]|uniref:Integral membrane protein n=1 Tax=Lentzea tibetensis TaxID=2591470 RepID=A0A563EL88_9PSEU|nr:hypothetical protein [Lentzea tibetensis]TWP47757.1 hypothetical protein FKR81_30915 [Lentzea tibetensis]
MTEPTAPPTAVRVAAGLWLATAVFAVLTLIGIWVLRDDLARQAGVQVGDVTSVLIALTIVTLAFGAAYVWLTSKLYQARKWARIGLSAIGVVHMLWLLVTGVSAASLVTLVLISVAVVLTWQPSTAKWMAEVGE